MTDLNDQRAELLIQRSIFETLEHKIVEKETKTHQARRIALDSGRIGGLARHRAAMAGRAEFCGVILEPKGYLFSDHERGVEPWRPDPVTLAFTRLCGELGIDGIRFHDLRRFAATSLFSAGIDVRTVSGRLGHANAATNPRHLCALRQRGGSTSCRGPRRNDPPGAADRVPPGIEGRGQRRDQLAEAQSLSSELQ